MPAHENVLRLGGAFFTQIVNASLSLLLLHRWESFKYNAVVKTHFDLSSYFLERSFSILLGKAEIDTFAERREIIFVLGERILEATPTT